MSSSAKKVPLKATGKTAEKAPPALKKLVLPDLTDTDKVANCLKVFAKRLEKQPSTTKGGPYDFAIKLQTNKKDKKKRVGPPRSVRRVSFPVLIATFSNIGPAGNFTGDDTDSEYGPADVSSAKSEVFVIRPTETVTEEDKICDKGYCLLKEIINSWDRQLLGGLADSTVSINYDSKKDHTLVKEIEGAKNKKGYDQEEMTETLLQRAYLPRKHKVTVFPNSSIKRKEREVLDERGAPTEEVTVTECLKFSRPLFPALYGIAADQAKKQPIAKRTAGWPEIFKGFEFYNHSISKAPEPKTPFNTKYDPLKIVDILGRTVDVFNSRLVEEDRQDLNLMLARLRRPIQGSLGIEFGGYVSSPRTFHTQARLTDLVLGVTWEMFIQLQSGSEQARETCDEAEIAAIAGDLFSPDDGEGEAGEGAETEPDDEAGEVDEADVYAREDAEGEEGEIVEEEVAEPAPTKKKRAAVDDDEDMPTTKKGKSAGRR